MGTGLAESSHDHRSPPATYWHRREEIAAHVSGLGRPAATIDYRPDEDHVWATVASGLNARWNEYACEGVLSARDRLSLPADRVPQLADVDARLLPITGFGYRAVAGILPAAAFFEALAERLFPSTQYVRWGGAPFYTPEPDVIHEVLGHGNCLACPQLAELHRLAGSAGARISTPQGQQMIADVFWFTAEFGVVREDGAAKAYGAGLLSSPGELEWFATHADLRPLDLVDMATVGYDIHRYQPVLFEGQSLDHVLEVVGEFYERATDESIARLLDGMISAPN